MGHDMTGHASSAAPTRGSYEERLPEAYIELLTLLEDMDVYVHQITQHCHESFEAEQRGAHLPAAYRNSP